MIDHTCDDNGINLLNTEEEADVTSIQSINGTNDIYMNDDEIFIHKYYAPFLPSKNNDKGGRFHSSLIRGDVLLLPHTSTVANKIT